MKTNRFQLASLSLLLIVLVLSAPAFAQKAKPTPGKSMLDASNHTLILIDHQPQTGHSRQGQAAQCIHEPQLPGKTSNLLRCSCFIA